MLKIVQAIETVDIFMQEYPQWNIHVNIRKTPGIPGSFFVLIVSP